MPEYNIVVAGDLHLSKDVPISRMEKPENFRYKQIETFKFLCETTHILNARLLITGDFFHRYDVRDTDLLISIMRNLRILDKTPLVIPGQHDMKNHVFDDVYNQTSLGVLHEANLIQILLPYHVYDIDRDINYIGIPWSTDTFSQITDKINKIKSKLSRDFSFNILLLHKYIANNKNDIVLKHNNDACFYKQLFTLNNINLFLTGDNHHNFVRHDNNNIVHIFNPGCLIQRTIKEKDKAGFYAITIDPRKQRIIKHKRYAIPEHLQPDWNQTKFHDQINSFDTDYFFGNNPTDVSQFFITGKDIVDAIKKGEASSKIVKRLKQVLQEIQEHQE